MGALLGGLALVAEDAPGLTTHPHQMRVQPGVSTPGELAFAQESGQALGLAEQRPQDIERRDVP